MDERVDGPLVAGRRFPLMTAIALFLIVVGAWGIRYAYLAGMDGAPGFAWSDPDGYTRQARALVGEDGRWRWSWDAVHYEWNARAWVLPPGYPVFLSVFALSPEAFPANAGYAHPVLGAVWVAALFWLGARLHSRRAGFIAAIVGALWFPNASGGNSFYQEQLYLPVLTLAFAATVDAWVRESRGPLFAVGGALFGLATLTRAMPLYFLPVAALVIVVGSRPRVVGWQRVGWLVGAFALTVGPYVACLSAAKGELILVDNHGAIEMDYRTSLTTTPGVGDSVGLLARRVSRDPVGFARDKIGFARALFQVQGGRWLQLYGASSTAGWADAWKWIAHLGIDLTFVCAALLAPLGLVVARRPREAILVALWIPELVTLSALASYGGARYRAPMEPHLIALASAALAGTWRRPSRASLAAGLCGVLAVGAIVLPQIPRSLQAHPNYGIGAWRDGERTVAADARGRAGFNLVARNGAATFMLALGEHGPPEGVATIVRVDGQPTWNLTVGSAPRRLTLRDATRLLRYIEIEPVLAAGQATPTYTITVDR